MDALSRTLMMKRPAQIVQRGPLPQLMTAGPRERYALLARARKLERQGRLQVIDQAPHWNDYERRYELRVIPQPAAPAWARRCIVAGLILTAVTVLLGLGWWFLTALTASSLAFFLAAVVCFFLALVIRGQRTSVSVSTTTVVKVRR